MRVLLVAPRGSAEPAYPLALAHAAAALLEREGHEITGADLAFDREEGLIESLSSPPDWIGAVVPIHDATEVRRVLDALRRPTTRTFVLGPLAALDPARAVRETGADLAVSNAPEGIAAALTFDATEGALSGCAVRRGDEVVLGPPAQRVPLASLPLADRRLFPVHRYTHAVRSAAKPYAAMVTSRGCTVACAYCPVPALAPGGFDARPAAQIHAEMAAMARDHQVRCVLFEDDLFVHDRARVIELCDLLDRQPLPLTWELVNGVRPDRVDEDLLARMGRAGCRRIVLSFEHVGEVRPNRVGYSRSEASRAVAAARRASIGVGGYFIVGLPGLDLAETLRGLANAFALGLDQAKFSPFVAVPGSPFFRYRDDLVGLPAAQARRLCQAAELAFFAQPRTALRLLRDLAADPRALVTLAHRAFELGHRGGPYPFRTAL